MGPVTRDVDSDTSHSPPQASAVTVTAMSVTGTCTVPEETLFFLVTVAVEP